MLHLFAALFKMPLWLLVLIAAGLGGLGYHSQQKAILHEAEKAALLASPEAMAVPISTFDAKPSGKTVVEAHVTARWAPEYNTKFFTTEKSGAQTPNGSLVLLMSETADKTGSKEVAAAIFVPPSKHDQLVEWLFTHSDDSLAPHPRLDIEGLVSQAGEYDRIGKMMTENNLSRAAGFFVLKPYLDGREAALKPDPEAVQKAPWVFWYVAVALTILAALRFVFRLLLPAPAAPAPQPKTNLPPPNPILAPKAKAANAIAKPNVAEAPTPAARFPRPNRSAKILIGLAFVVLLVKSGLAGMIAPFAVLGLAYYGFHTLKSKASVSSIRALDKLTGVAEPFVAPTEASPLLHTQLNLPKSLAYQSAIISTPSASARAFDLLKSRRFTAWLSFAVGIGMLLGTAYISGGAAGIKHLADAIMAPLTGATGALNPVPLTDPTALVLQVDSLGATDTAADAMVPAAYASGLRNIGLTLAAALLFAYIRRWLNRRHGLALHDPWEKLDTRLR